MLPSKKRRKSWAKQSASKKKYNKRKKKGVSKAQKPYIRKAKKNEFFEGAFYGDDW